MGAQARRGDVAVVVATVAASAIVWFPASAITIALPTLRDVFDTSVSELAWIPSVYMLVFAATLVGAGRAVDRIGRRRSMVAGAVVFTLASGAAAASERYWMLLGAIALLGVGGVLLTTSSVAIIDQRFEGRSRARVIGLWSAGSGAGQALGIPAGGLLLESPLGWPSIFWIVAPVSALVGLITFRNVEESRAASPAPFDVVGAVALGATLVLLGLACIQAPTWGARSPATIAVVLAALALAATTWWWARRAADPIVPRALLRSRQLVGSVVLMGLANIPLSGALFALPLFLQSARGDSAARAGVLLLALAGTVGLASAFGEPVGTLVGRRAGTAAGLAVGAAGLLMLAPIDAGTSYGAMLPGLLIAGAGIGLIAPLVTTAAMEVAPVEQAGVTGGLIGASAFLGGTLGVAIAAGLFSLFAGPDASAALAAGDAERIARGVSRSLLVLGLLTLSFVPVALLTISGRRR